MTDSVSTAVTPRIAWRVMQQFGKDKASAMRSMQDNVHDDEHSELEISSLLDRGQTEASKDPVAVAWERIGEYSIIIMGVFYSKFIRYFRRFCRYFLNIFSLAVISIAIGTISRRFVPYTPQEETFWSFVFDRLQVPNIPPFGIFRGPEHTVFMERTVFVTIMPSTETTSDEGVPTSVYGMLPVDGINLDMNTKTDLFAGPTSSAIGREITPIASGATNIVPKAPNLGCPSTVAILETLVEPTEPASGASSTLRLDSLIPEGIIRTTPANDQWIAMKNYASYALGARPNPRMHSSTYKDEWWRYFLGASFEILGISSGSPLPPKAALELNLEPGNCWAFAGKTGHIAISLSEPILITHVGYDHVSNLLVNSVETAPRTIKVSGLLDAKSVREILTIPADLIVESPPFYPSQIQVSIANISYNASTSDASQTFPAFEELKKSQIKFKTVLFNITDNWGADKMTCLYHLRVHGTT